MDQLNREQRQAADAILEGKSLFITGPGGAGKSFLLQTLYEHYRTADKTLAITAMTGCAALLIGPYAKTLHSWAGIGLGRVQCRDDGPNHSGIERIASCRPVDQHGRHRPIPPYLQAAFRIRLHRHPAPDFRRHGPAPATVRLRPPRPAG